MKNQLITDLLSEMKSKCISGTFEVQGHNYEMQLLDGGEGDWRDKYVSLNGLSLEKGSINMALLSAVKKPTLAIGIRAIDGESVETLFESDWVALEGATKTALLAESVNAKTLFIAGRLLDFLINCPGDVIEELWSSWVKLEKRRDEAKGELKKSSGENEKKENSTDSPSGEK